MFVFWGWHPKYHTRNDLKQQKFALSQLWGEKKPKNHGIGRWIPPEALRGKFFRVTLLPMVTACNFDIPWLGKRSSLSFRLCVAFFLHVSVSSRLSPQKGTSHWF